MYDDTILIGDLAYDYLANVTFDQVFPDWLGYSPLPEYTYSSIDHLFPASPSGSVTPPSAMYVLALLPFYFPRSPLTSHLRGTPSLFSPSPSPSLSQASSTLEHNQASPQPSPTPEPSCRRATPIFNHVRGKWCCSVCDKTFRGNWECKRHIETSGKRAMCPACGGKLSREDSLRRHLKKYCKGDVANLRFEDASTEV